MKNAVSSQAPCMSHVISHNCMRSPTIACSFPGIVVGMHEQSILVSVGLPYQSKHQRPTKGHATRGTFG